MIWVGTIKGIDLLFALDYVLFYLDPSSAYFQVYRKKKRQ